MKYLSDLIILGVSRIVVMKKMKNKKTKRKAKKKDMGSRIMVGKNDKTNDPSS